jgi:transcriptional regulator with XRE-family HTH domain
MTENGSPTLRRRRLGQELRKLRTAADIALDVVAEYLECSAAKVSRIETGKVPVSVRDVRDMLDQYTVDADKREELLALAKDSKRQGWWERYSEAVPKGASTFLGLESEADEAFVYEPLFVPGLLQSPGYARAVLSIGGRGASTELVEQRLEVRMERQKRLTCRDSPLRLHAIVDEAALLREVGGAQVMAEQYQHLIEVLKLPNVTLRYVDRTEGAYPGMGSAFTVFGFEDPDDQDVVYLEQSTSALFLESSNDVEAYRRIYEQMRTCATSPAVTVELIDSLIESRYTLERK